MKNKKSTRFGIMILAALVSLAGSREILAQERFTIDEKSEMVIKGTSTLHDWETKATELNGSGVFDIKNQTIASIDNFKLLIPVRSLEGSKKGMDNKIYEALKADKAPNIDFELSSIDQVSSDKIVVSGKMTVAGKSKNVKLESSYKIENGSLHVNGTHAMKMTEFDVAPPTAMMGAIKAGDQVQIEYNLILQNENNNLRTSKKTN